MNETDKGTILLCEYPLSFNYRSRGILCRDLCFGYWSKQPINGQIDTGIIIRRVIPLDAPNITIYSNYSLD